MNIFILYHSERREKMIYDMIAERVRELAKDADITVENVGHIFDLCYEKKPDVVFTVPIRDEHMVAMMTAIKLLYNCKIICLTTEGVENFDNEDMLRMRIGDFPFSDKLIDYYYYWGPLPTRLFRDILMENHRMSEPDRVGTCGYVLYEKNALKKYLGDSNEILKSAKRHFEKYGKLMLFVTGFLYYIDIVEERLGCSSFPPYSSQEEYDEHVRVLRHLDDENISYRECYIDNICTIAEKYPDRGIIVKYHPIEIGVMRDNDYYPYERLKKYENVLVIEDTFPIGALYEYTDLFFHYGSTTGVETYMYGVPSILLSRKCHEKIDEKYGYLYGDTYFPSTMSIQVDDISRILEVVDKGIAFRKIEEIDEYLYNVFNFKHGEKYEPTSIMANEILAGKCRQEIKGSDEKVKYTFKSDEMLNFRLFYYKKSISCLKHGKLGEAAGCIKQAVTIMPNAGYLFVDVFRQAKLSLSGK